MTKNARHTSADTPAGGGAIAADVATTDDGVSDGAVGAPGTGGDDKRGRQHHHELDGATTNRLALRARHGRAGKQFPIPEAGQILFALGSAMWRETAIDHFGQVTESSA